jgi:CBS domain-containing protein
VAQGSRLRAIPDLAVSIKEDLDMLISEVMTRDVELVAPDTDLSSVACRMRDRDIGVLPVGDNDRLVGMVTDRDIVVNAIAAGLDPARTTAREVMSPKVLYCFEDQSVDEVLANMGAEQVRRLPVVNRHKKLVGIVSLGDLAKSGPNGKSGEALKEISECR